jgi:hypothetical protein
VILERLQEQCGQIRLQNHITQPVWCADQNFLLEQIQAFSIFIRELMTSVAAGYRNNSRQEEENYSVLIQSLCRPSYSARLEDL